jgi:chromosome segregation ATPase
LGYYFEINAFIDQFEEEQEKLKKELHSKREELDRREESIAARENELDELRKRTERFSDELNEVVSKAKEETAKRLSEEAKARENLMKKEFEGERNVLLTRIESLEKTIKEQTQQINRLSQNQDKAYQQVQDIAFKAVEGASNLRSLSQTLAVQSQAERRKTEKEE